MGRTGTRAGATGDIITPATGLANELGTTGKEFGVIAYNTGSADWAGTSNTITPNFMYNQKVSCTSGTTWTYAPIKYWPNGIDAGNTSGDPSKTAAQATEQKLSFFAYAPYVELSSTTDLTSPGIVEINGCAQLSGANIGNNKTGEPTVKYRLDPTVNANQVDLLWGTRGDNTYSETDGTNNTESADYNVNLTKQVTGEKVNFLFKHALAKIENIQIRSTIDNNTGSNPDSKTCITVRSISIQNAASNFASEGVFNLATGQWSGLNNGSASLGSAFNFAAGTGTMNTAIFNAAANETNDGSAWSQTGVTGTAANVLNGDFPAYYVIPVGSAQQLTCTIDYDVKTVDGNLSGGYSSTNQVITNTISCNFQAGYKYKLILWLGLTSVKFTASVANWNDGDAQNVWLPSNVVATPAP